MQHFKQLVFEAKRQTEQLRRALVAEAKGASRSMPEETVAG